MTVPPIEVTSADGVRIRAHELGGSGPMLLVAHATGFCAAMYRAMAAGLTSRRRVVAIDFRGHGSSDRPANDDFHWDRMADDVLALVDHLGGPVDGFGHSMGGAALLLAELRRPGTLATAYLFEPIVFPAGMTREGPNLMAEAARSRRPSFPSQAEALWRYARRPPLNTMRADVLAAYVEHGFAEGPDGTAHLACAPADEARVFEADGKATIEAVTGLAVPTVVAAGHDEPGPNPGAFSPRIAEVLADARFERFGSIGHFGPFQDPDGVAAAVAAHLDAHPRHP